MDDEIKADAGAEDDPAMTAWPAEVRQSWAAMRLPSLADQLLAYERLAAEVRRQNQELRRLATTLTTTQPQTPVDDGGRLAAALEAVNLLSDGLAKGATTALIDLYEANERHATALALAVETHVAKPVAHGWFGQSIAWPTAITATLRAQVTGARLVANKALDALAAIGLMRIAPSIGDIFDPERHFCAGTRSGPAGRILSLERIGWSHGSTRIRPADVIVGKDPL